LSIIDQRRAISMLIEVTAIGAVAGAVLWGGAIRPPASLALAGAGALLLLLAAAEEEEPRLSPLALPILVVLAAALAQLVPLPHGLRALLSPSGERITELVLRGIPHASWRPLTTDVSATLHGAARLAGLAALAAACGTLSATRHRNVLRVALYVGLAVLVAVPALAALGVELPYTPGPRGVTFSLVNPNHVAAFLALVLPTVLVRASRAEGGARYGLIGLALAGNMVLAVTVSRAGMLLGAAAQLTVLWWLRRGRWPALAAAVVLFAGLAFSGTPLAERLRPGDTGRQRWMQHRDALPILRDYPVAGVGVGAFGGVFARYSRLAAQNRFPYVENEYLQLPLDVGWPAALAALAALAWALRQVWPALREPSTRTRAAAVGLGAVALHNLVDFNWETGAVAAGVCIVCGLAFPARGWKLGRAWVVGFAALCAALVALAAASPGAEAEAQRLRAVKLERAPFARLAEETFRRHPGDGFIADVAAERLLRDGGAGEWLDRALLLGPHDVLAHYLTSVALLQIGARDQAALELRVAIDRGEASDRAWLYDHALTLFAADGERLLAALPEDVDVLRRVAERAAERRLWPAARRAGRAALALAPRDPRMLAVVVRAGVELKDMADLPEQAQALAEADPAQTRLAAQALAFAGRADAAEKALRAALDHAAGDDAVEMAVALAGLARQRNDLDGAAAVLDTALARAVLPRHKARLHVERAAVDDQAGRIHRAQAERAEAERLLLH
jgi:O-antigen ligase